MENSKEAQMILLKEILDEVKDVKKIEKNNSRHLGRHSNMINYAQTMLKTLWDERLIKEKEDKDKDKTTIKKLKEILITIIVTACLLALGVNNIPEAITKIGNLL